MFITTISCLKMVVRRKLELTVLVIVSILASAVSVKFCWYGEDNKMNMTCSTGDLHPANMMSRAAENDASDSTENEPGHLEPERDYQCMVFLYNETYKWKDGVDIVPHVNFTCDLHRYCHGLQGEGGVKFRVDGHEGLLYCCNSTDNCNTPAVLTRQKCYTGSGGSHHEYEVTDCASTELYCSTVTSNNIVHTGCDVKNVCTHLNKDGALSLCHFSEDTEEETCCCQGPLCNNPGPSLGPAMVKRTQSSLQKTLLIVIGVTLGVLLMGVAVYMYRRFRPGSLSTESPSKVQYHSTQYSTVAGEVDDDKVHIIQHDGAATDRSRNKQAGMEML
ncbi:uncharacterized protein LOC127834052 [Dreissena polymorpha]|nr:uncharacterized protein LOC127834052 [Dreissena polymorpha]